MTLEELYEALGHMRDKLAPETQVFVVGADGERYNIRGTGGVDDNNRHVLLRLVAESL